MTLPQAASPRTARASTRIRLKSFGVLSGTVLATLLGGCAPPDVPAASGSDGDPETPRALWVDETARRLPATAEWTNKVELADLNGDGRLDFLFANGGNYSEPGDPEMNRAFLNRGGDGGDGGVGDGGAGGSGAAEGGSFVEATAEVFGATPDLTRVIKARDVDGDGDVDVFVGNTYETPSRLFLGEGGGRFSEASDRLPPEPGSFGDAEFGDVDGDGDLDLALADWGPGNNMINDGGRTRLWLNDGTGRFTDATEARMPETLVRFSWDLELVDVDNDFDLDILVSCKRCPGSVLFRNDGTGVFTEDFRGLPAYTNNYEFEAMDLDGDGFLDLVTVNDGEIVGERGSSRREHVFRNDGEGRFRDATDGWWPDSENVGEDDNVVAFLDWDSDGDADFLVGSLSGPDRLLINDGAGGLRVALDVFQGEDTPGTLGMAIGDLDGDHRIDVVQSQGEHPTAVEERIFVGSGLEPDSAPPSVGPAAAFDHDGEVLVLARAHDRKSPLLATEFREVEVRFQVMDAPRSVDMEWMGEYLWRATVPPEAHGLEVCATDAAGHGACLPVPEPGSSEEGS